MYRIPQEMAGQQPVVYQLPKEQDKKRRQLLGGKPYSIWSASKYILMISLMLYWLPLVGQMIGGFIGGRRAGSPFRAILAALIPVAVLFMISTALQTGIIPIKLQNATVLAYTLIAQGLERLPIASPYLNFATTYVGSFINELKSAASLKLGNYLITIAFAYVGGILSDQSRRELEYVSRYGAPTTNILVNGREAEQRREFRLPSPSSFFHALMPSRRPQQQTGFASLMPVSYNANGEMAAAVNPPPEARRVVAQQEEYSPPRVTRRRIAPRQFQPKSWEDVYLRNMRIAGVSGSRVDRPGKSWEFTDVEPEELSPIEMVDEKPPAVRQRANSSTPVVRKDRIRDESTRKLVERALGKDYMKNMSGSRRKLPPAQGSGHAQSPARKVSENPRKNGEWELL